MDGTLEYSIRADARDAIRSMDEWAQASERTQNILNRGFLDDPTKKLEAGLRNATQAQKQFEDATEINIHKVRQFTGAAEGLGISIGAFGPHATRAAMASSLLGASIGGVAGVALALVPVLIQGSVALYHWASGAESAEEHLKRMKELSEELHAALGPLAEGLEKAGARADALGKADMQHWLNVPRGESAAADSQASAQKQLRDELQKQKLAGITDPEERRRVIAEGKRADADANVTLQQNKLTLMGEERDRLSGNRSNLQRDLEGQKSSKAGALENARASGIVSDKQMALNRLGELGKKKGLSEGESAEMLLLGRNKKALQQQVAGGDVTFDRTTDKSAKDFDPAKAEIARMTAARIKAASSAIDKITDDLKGMAEPATKLEAEMKAQAIRVQAAKEGVKTAIAEAAADDSAAGRKGVEASREADAKKKKEAERQTKENQRIDANNAEARQREIQNNLDTEIFGLKLAGAGGHAGRAAAQLKDGKIHGYDPNEHARPGLGGIGTGWAKNKFGAGFGPATEETMLQKIMKQNPELQELLKHTDTPQGRSAAKKVAEAVKLDREAHAQADAAGRKGKAIVSAYGTDAARQRYAEAAAKRTAERNAPKGSENTEGILKEILGFFQSNVAAK